MNESEFANSVHTYAKLLFPGGQRVLPHSVAPPGDLSLDEVKLISSAVGWGHSACIAKRLYEEGRVRESWDSGLVHWPTFLHEFLWCTGVFLQTAEKSKGSRLTRMLMNDCFVIGYESARSGEIVESHCRAMVVEYRIAPPAETCRCATPPRGEKHER